MNELSNMRHEIVGDYNDANCIFYNLNSTDPSLLQCLKVKNGTNLKLILEKIDRKLCSIDGSNLVGSEGLIKIDINNVNNYNQVIGTLNIDLLLDLIINTPSLKDKLCSICNNNPQILGD